MLEILFTVGVDIKQWFASDMNASTFPEELQLYPVIIPSLHESISSSNHLEVIWHHHIGGFGQINAYFCKFLSSPEKIYLAVCHFYNYECDAHSVICCTLYDEIACLLQCQK